MDLKTQLETVAKNHQASIQNLKTKFNRLDEKQSGRSSGFLPSNTQPNPKGHNSKAYQPPQARNKHVNAVFTRSGKSYNPPVNSNDQHNDAENPINFDSDDEEPTPQLKTKNPKPVKETSLPKPYKPKISIDVIDEVLEEDFDALLDEVKVFMDDFSVFRNSFETCLTNLDKMLQYCKDVHLVLNWEKCHFMVKEGIVLGHKVSGTGLEVDKAKIDVISKLPPPTNIKAAEKDTPFEFNDECQKAFKLLKEKLTCAPVIVSPNWNLPFELMCDASDFAVGAIFGQKD
nr:retrovirus-related Pol polyprotein [Tanacetum cinerariifolium]